MTSQKNFSNRRLYPRNPFEDAFSPLVAHRVVVKGGEKKSVELEHKKSKNAEQN
jgi:azurin